MDKLIESLIKKASEAKTAGEAMHYSQAALNAANALLALSETAVSNYRNRTYISGVGLGPP